LNSLEQGPADVLELEAHSQETEKLGYRVYPLQFFATNVAQEELYTLISPK